MQQNHLSDVKARKQKIALTIVLLMLSIPTVGTAILFAVISRQSNHINGLCKSHMTTLSSAFMAYAKQHDDTLPPAAKWAKSIKPYVGDISAYRCPNDRTKGFTSYAMNTSLGGKKLSSLKDTSKLVLLYEVDKAGDSPHGDGSNMYDVGHENGGHGRHGGNFYRFNFYLFADGGVSFPKSFDDTYTYYWQNGVKPKPAPPQDSNDKGQGLVF